MKKIKLKFGDLFSGAGGLSLGLEHSKYQGTYEGFKSIWALDDHKDSCETY
ncbi:MAG: DNA (cytosine-5-)-methyltransferase, partial [Actinobacteria bacterium]|nr:DNA (cytosine-5-)-methyltransferase [Actinomycetota bacterium]